MRIAVISGHDLNLSKEFSELKIKTSYGDVMIRYANIWNRDVFLLNRHESTGSALPPHKINYRANIDALSRCKVDTVLSVGTVGSINKEIKPGSIVIPHDFIDFTKNRTYTFFDEGRVHVDMSRPFCEYLRRIVSESCKEMGLEYKDRATYLVSEGPRLETPAEIRLFSGISDVVGMTLVPEVILAREKGMCYVSICVVCNMAAGLQDRLPAKEIVDLVNKKRSDLEKLIVEVIKKIEDDRDCDCRQALREAKI